MLDEQVQASISWLCVIGTVIVWVRSYVRSRRGGWLLMAASMGAPAMGLMLAYFFPRTPLGVFCAWFPWLAIGSFLLFVGALSLCRDLCPAEKPASPEQTSGG
jgi:uncharacterized membrane protein HdeD (DUF308 family)